MSRHFYSFATQFFLGCYSVFATLVPACCYANASVDLNPLPIGILDLPRDTDELIVVGERVFMPRNRGFMVADISEPEHPVLLADTDLGQSVTAMGVSGSLLFINTTRALLVYEISNLDIPNEIGRIEIRTDEGFLEVFGDYVYLSTRQELEIIDVSDPANPRLHDTFQLGPDVYRSIRQGDAIYLTFSNFDDSRNFAIVDARDPSNPSLEVLGDLDYDASNGVLIGSSPDRLYLGGTPSGAGGISVLDITTPLVPVEIAHEGFYSSDPYFSVATLPLRQDIFVATRPGGFYSNLDVIEVQPDGSFAVSASYRFGSGNIIYALEEAGDYVVGTDLDSLLVFDFSEAKPPRVDNIEVPSGVITEAGLSENVVFGESSGEITIATVSPSGSFLELDATALWVLLDNEGEFATLPGELLGVHILSSEVKIIDLRDPEAPSISANIPVPAEISEGNVEVLKIGEHLVVILVEDTGAAEVQFYPVTESGGVEALERSFVLPEFDVSGEARPSGWFSAGYEIEGGCYIYRSLRGRGAVNNWTYIELSQGLASASVHDTSLDATVRQMVLTGKHGFCQTGLINRVGSYLPGLGYFDASDPLNPTVFPVFEDLSWPDMALTDKILYVAAGLDGVLVYDVSVPLDPVIFGRNTAVFANAIDVDESRVIVGAGAGGDYRCGGLYSFAPMTAPVRLSEKDVPSIRAEQGLIYVEWDLQGAKLQWTIALNGSWETLENAVSPHVLLPDTDGFFRLVVE